MMNVNQPMNLCYNQDETEPMNLWLINERNFEHFLFSGGKIITISEDDQELIKMMANYPIISGYEDKVMSANSLLPPIEAVQAEFDDDHQAACDIYWSYLQTEIPDQYISIMLMSGYLVQQPLGVYFGHDERDTPFPNMFLDFMYYTYGIIFGRDAIIFGRDNASPPIIFKKAVPLILAKIYGYGYINYASFMLNHPEDPICPFIIPKLAQDINPAVPVKDIQHYAEYFNTMKEEIRKTGRFLQDPIVGI